MIVNLEILCIGNELLIGKIKDTNAHYLATKATQLGVNVNRVTVIQDIVEEIAKTILECVERKPQFIVTTGGLGPTFDDKTLQGIAQALNCPLEVNAQALEMVKQRCEEYAAKRHMQTQIELTASRVKMATLPKGTQPVNNPLGSAPGVHVNFGGTILFALPGVPAEMEAIFAESIAPLFKVVVGGNVFCERSLFVDGVTESHLVPLVDKVMMDNVGVYVKSHPMRSEGKPYLEIHLTMRATQEQKPVEKLRKAAKELAVLIEASGGRIQAES
jgi:molybdenum cofactor synthesis domain-containing protein